ncbi:trans-sulfuration enzyme family protein [Clostridium folliculivorans]|uniref:homocysteine desulfhydrase n=1 Tax=Clostridium folliculivorans TaxID=2886038 RepID=A0A9W6DBJ1_9CLOT|nr:PLP-dependent aspartate aminotransferase family protein [Clostridium folliculivorans]GKU26324.1 methionine gamma-lyase [Clostridium folliculivorans]GKU32121.1 methionine gamma-lyase [Clostridium folliculivorans]
MKGNFSTRLTHLGEKSPKSVSRSKTIPISMTSVFVFDDVETLDKVYDNEEEGYVYSRNGNPGHDALEEIIAGIDEAEDAQVFSSGMGAIAMSIVANVKAGDHIIAASVLYGGSYTFLKQELAKFNVEVTFVDVVNESIEQYFKSNTKVVYVETISNPLMEVIDIKDISELTHKHNAKLIVDNTFATGVICQPLKLGADIVVYSATKYICGHSDVTGGIVVADRDNVNKIRNTGALYGPMMSPFDAWLLIRSLRTLELRLKKHSENALKLAEYLEKHEKIKTVYYPGLKSSSYYEVAKELFNGDEFGGMLSIDVLDGERGAYELIRNLESIKFVPSLAGVTTSVSYPVKTSHRALTDQELKKANISKGLIRVSVGLEDIDDIISEFDKALAKI